MPIIDQLQEILRNQELMAALMAPTTREQAAARRGHGRGQGAGPVRFRGGIVRIPGVRGGRRGGALSRRETERLFSGAVVPTQGQQQQHQQQQAQAQAQAQEQEEEEEEHQRRVSRRSLAEGVVVVVAVAEQSVFLFTYLPTVSQQTNDIVIEPLRLRGGIIRIPGYRGRGRCALSRRETERLVSGDLVVAKDHDDYQRHQQDQAQAQAQAQAQEQAQTQAQARQEEEL
ncbi:hypothetical protein V8C43DRAFT_306764 [Trichoderma afarasin]